MPEAAALLLDMAAVRAAAVVDSADAWPLVLVVAAAAAS